MTEAPRRLLLAAASGLCLALAASAFARQAADDGTIAVVDAEMALIRSGADQSYYPLAQLKRGQFVRVVGEKHEWARIRLDGPAFADAFAYLKFRRDEPGKFRLADDGRSGVTLGLTPVFAPNYIADMDARDSWRAVANLQSDTPVTVLDTFETELDRVFKIRMPASAEAFVSRALLRPATNAEVTRWHEALAALAAGTPLPAKTTGTGRTDLAAAPARVTPAAATTAAAPPTDTTAIAPPDVTPVEANAAPLAIEEPVAPPLPAAAPATGAGIEGTAEEQLRQLDAALQRLAESPLEDAEVQPLRNLYQQLSRQHADNARVRRYAEARSAQLALWAQLQVQRRELEDLRTRVRIRSEETSSARLAFEAAGDYTAVGRLMASTIYNGRDLPRLLRLQDPGTGRTIAYLRPGRDFDLVGMLGQLIGVSGQTTYDPGLRLQVIQPRRIDILAPQSTM